MTKTNFPNRRWLTASAPQYAPSLWSSYLIQEYSNCYGYALDLRPDPTGVHNIRVPPGRRGVHPDVVRGLGPTDGRELAELLRSDRLVRISPRWSLPRGSGHLVAAVASLDTSVRDGFSSHFYRLDSNGWWSHKPGSNPVTDLDAARQRITDPRLASRPDYPIWLGYWWVTP